MDLNVNYIFSTNLNTIYAVEIVTVNLFPSDRIYSLFLIQKLDVAMLGFISIHDSHRDQLLYS